MRPKRCFVKELAGETPPSFPAMERLYRLGSDLYGLRPWRVLDEDNLIVVRDSVTGAPCFRSGETPPSFPAMERLYRLGSDLYGLRPWRVLDEDNLIVVRDSVTGELCYCSVMGALGEVLS